MSEMDLSEDAALRSGSAAEPVDDIEAPEADAAEQRVEAVRSGGADTSSSAATAEANPADVAEQAREVELDEDDYR